MDDNERNNQIEELLREISERRENAKRELQMESYAKDVKAIQNENRGITENDYGKAIKEAKSEEPKAEASFAQTTLFDRRSILNSITKEYKPTVEEEYDPINKNMLAPTIERGVDVLPPKTKQKGLLEEEIFGEAEVETEYTEHHSIFTDDAYVPDVIPGEVKKNAEQNPETLRDERFETGQVILDSAAKNAQKKGVLNVKDNIDDNFREFFGNTVVIDKEPLNEKTKKQRKIKDFVFTDTETGFAGGPVFEDEKVEDKLPQLKKENESAAELLEDLLYQKGKDTLKTVLTGILAAITVLLSIARALGFLSGSLESPELFYIINAVILLIAIIINGARVFRGFGELISFKATSYSLVSFAAIASLFELVMLVLTNPEQGGVVSATVSCAALFFMSLGLSNNSKRMADSFSDMFNYDEKFASTVLADQSFTRKISRDLDLTESRVIIKRRTEYTDNYITHAENYDMITKNVALTGSVLLIVCVVLGVVSYFISNSVSAAISAMAFAAAMCAPFMATLSSSMPIGTAQRRLTKQSAYIPGYSAAEEIRQANSVVLSGREIFPKSNVILNGIKTFDRERVDKAILYAASVLIKSCDTMAHMFLNVIQNKTEMLYDVDGIEYESNIGYSFWVEKERIILGTREMLEAHDIAVPSRDYENRYTKTSTRDAIYLAVGGKLYAMFVVSYSPNEEVASALKELEEAGINIIIHTRDFNISSDKVSKLFDIPKKMVAVVREDDVPELSKRTAFVEKTASSLTHMGTLTSFINGIIACGKLDGTLRIAMTLELVGMIAGAVLASALVLFSTLTGTTVLAALLFQLVWLLIGTAGICIRK